MRDYLWEYVDLLQLFQLQGGDALVFSLSIFFYFQVQGKCGGKWESVAGSTSSDVKSCREHTKGFFVWR